MGHPSPWPGEIPETPMVYKCAMPPEPPGRPLPPAKSPSKDSPLQSLVRIESLIQLALLLPAAVVVGWALGLALDRWLDQHWINIAGLIAGAVAGFVQIFRVVLSHSKE
jgi:ATP synthase protein I